MNENVKTYLFLKCNAIGYLLFDEKLILVSGQLALAECRTICFNIGSLRERAYCRGREKRELKTFFLYLFALGECGKPYKVAFGKRSDFFSYGCIPACSLLTVKRSIAAVLVCFIRLVGAEYGFQLCKLCQLFFSISKMLFIAFGQLGLVFERAGNVQQRAGGVQLDIL